ncbi:HXXEE domain-containing protein [Lamprobacter modestohalophilus]|uniref:HXXEE domain-containing protein n=1 Tax=Lamprobacter modestohalophilus TaxID=1064514 RepID=UPI002ADEDE06|nr:HXXEE domain-containing protein [Lamprobacter modestohalophilus]MEA1053660.1 HXXEE domain-containing protein [Lamprobacter modestohalophilus]
MSHDYILWIATFAYAFHVVEEYMFDWKNWAINVIKLPLNWVHFSVVNAVVIIFGISCSSVAWSLPAYALSLPALMLINATLFHVLPFIKTKGRFSPGLGSAVLLFYPISIWAYYGAYLDGVLTVSTLTISFIIGAILMASPIVMLKLRLHPYFNQDK